MGRLGRLPVVIPDGVKVELEDRVLHVSGPKGELNREIPRKVVVEINDGEVIVNKKGDSKPARALQGTYRAHIENMIHGVSEGWSRQLEINGPGYRAEAQPNKLTIVAGYSHPVIIDAPEGISFKVEKNIITVEGANKEDVGHVASLVRGARKPNPYTGSGVRYIDEVIRRKAGKQAGAKE